MVWTNFSVTYSFRRVRLGSVSQMPWMGNKVFPDKKVMSKVKPSKISSAKAPSIPCDKHRSYAPNKISRIGVNLHNLDATERGVVETVNPGND